EKKGFGMVFINKANGFASFQFDQKAFLFHEFVVSVEGRNSVAFVSPVIGPGVDDAQEVVEAALQREKTSGATTVPFAKNTVGVSGFSQHVGQGYLAQIHAERRFRLAGVLRHRE